MDDKKFQLIKHYVGIELLRFILNKDDLAQSDQFNNLNLNQNQIEVLCDLCQKIQDYRIHHIQQCNSGEYLEHYLKQLFHNNSSIYNHYRTHCGGNLTQSKNSPDPVLNFLESVCIKSYPNLLIKQANNHRFSNFDIQISWQNSQQFINLIKQDHLDKLTNQQDELDYRFEFTTTCGLSFSHQIVTAATIIITRSFQNCCNRMQYGFDDLYAEIASNLELLRKLARGEEVIFPSFIGIRGLYLDDMDQINLNDATLFQLNSLSNPGNHTLKIALVNPTDEGKYLSGTVLEVSHKTRVQSQEPVNTIYSCSDKISSYEDKILNNIKFSLLFTLEEDSGIASVFYETGFPLINPGNGSSNSNLPQKNLILNQNNIAKFKDWFKLLNQADLKKVQVPLKRLESAIFQRYMPEDAIVDAIIAWEGMFSEAFETTFKVTGSITKFLKEQPERKEFFARMKKLYGLRSDIVHGKKSKLIEREDVYELRSEVIKIGLECLAKLLKDPELLPLSPHERVHKIVIWD